jgi:hypothetical protein
LNSSHMYVQYFCIASDYTVGVERVHSGCRPQPRDGPERFFKGHQETQRREVFEQ